MSAIDGLVAELCPDGAEHQKMGDVSKYIRGITYNKHQESLDGEGWRVLRANNIDLFSGTLNFNDVKVIKKEVNVPPAKLLRAGDVFICAGSGSRNHVGKVAFVDEDLPFTFGGFMGVIRVDSQDILPKFVYHVLRSDLFRSYLTAALDSTTINNLNAKIVNAFEIPVPPIEVQREIVRILDTFTTLTDELTAKLAEEVAARKEQYAYYRDRLLSRESLEAMDGKPVEMVNLGDLFDTFTGKTPRKSDTMLYGSDFPFYKPGDYDHGGVADKSSDMLSSSGFENARQVKPGSILVTCIGATIGKVGFVQRKGTCNQQINVILPNKIVNSKFVFHYCCSSKFQTTVWKKANHSSIPNLSLSSFNNIPIPVPSLATQQRVVDILDRLDALTTSLTDGIPAEIEARKAQYEYYRDRLLEFPRKGGAAA